MWTVAYIVFALLWSPFTIPAPEPNEHLTDRVSSVANPNAAQLGV